MLVKFLREVKVLDGSKKVRQHFLAGQVVELSTASARHWLNREMAERVSASVPQFPPKAEVMPAAETKKPDPFSAFRQKQGAEPKPQLTAMPDPEPVKRKPGRPKKVTAGSSLAAGSETPSPSAPEDQASPEIKSSTSVDDAGSSSSTTHTSSLPGQTSYTPAMPAGGESTETPPDSED